MHGLFSINDNSPTQCTTLTYMLALLVPALLVANEIAN